MLSVYRFDLERIRILCKTIFTICSGDAKLPEELRCIYIEHALHNDNTWCGRPYDYVCLVRFLNKMSYDVKHNALCDALARMEKESEKNLLSEAEYMVSCNDLKACNDLMKSVEKIVDVFEYQFLMDESIHSKVLELKYKDHLQYEISKEMRQVVWMSPSGNIVF